MLEALDHRIEIARAAIDAGERDRWMVRHVEPYTDALLLSFTGEPDGEGDAFCVGTLDVQENFWRLIEANDPKTTLAQLEGRRRILQRHAPVQAVDADVALCARCSGYSPVAWPCPDWLDAASGLENTE